MRMHQPTRRPVLIRSLYLLDIIIGTKAYAVVGSKLFFFGGLDVRNRDCRRCLYYYDFSRDMRSSTTVNIDESSLESGPPMKGRKISPYAAVVGGYKICVFAARLYASFKGNGFAKWGPPNFEVFNTIDWSWTELPELTEYRECGLNAIFLTSYCIVRSCLVICTDIGMYGINIDAVCPKWVKMEGRQRIPPSLKRWEMIGENACGPFEVVRWGEAKANPLAFRNKGSFIPFDGCGVLCSERVDNVTMLCGVYSTIRDDWVPVLLVNVAKFDNELLDSLRGEKWKTIESDESWVFAIESQECEVMDLMSCFQYTETKMGNPAFRVPLHYPRCDEADYETMEEWRLDLLLSEYGFNLNNATIQEKRNFAMGAFLWPTQY